MMKHLFSSCPNPVRFENAMATMLQKHVHFLQDRSGRELELHYVRIQLVGQLRQAQSRQGVLVTDAATWIAELSA